MVKEKSNLGKFLESRFLAWQQELGRRATLVEYADYLNLDRTQLSQYINGNILPKKEVVDRIAKKVGYEIYDLLNYERPDPFVEQLLEAITDPSERKVLQEFLKYSQGLDDEGREEIYRRLQSENTAGIGSYVKTKPSPKAE